MYTIFISDDEFAIREGLKSLVDWEALGFKICGEASNGSDSLANILAKRPDISILDIRMPKLHGIDVIKEAREQGYIGKFILLSGYSDFRYAQNAIRYGVDYYLTKPIDEDELSLAISELKTQLDQEYKKIITYLYVKGKLNMLSFKSYLQIRMNQIHLFYQLPIE